jgi:hypothetical protein
LALEWWGILLMGSGRIPITIKPVGVLFVVSAIPYFTGGMRVRGIALCIVVVVLLTWVTGIV